MIKIELHGDGGVLELTRDTEANHRKVKFIYKMYAGDETTLGIELHPADVREALKKMMG